MTGFEDQSTRRLAPVSPLASTYSDRGPPQQSRMIERSRDIDRITSGPAVASPTVRGAGEAVSLGAAFLALQTTFLA